MARQQRNPELSQEETRQERPRGPWWQRPSPWWYLCLVPLSSIADNATAAPRVELLTMLACEHLKPEYIMGHSTGSIGFPNTVHTPESTFDAANLLPAVTSSDPPLPWFITASLLDSMNAGSATRAFMPDPSLCKVDPDVQRAVAKLTTAMTITLGVLGVLTVGWWGTVSDRIGRTRVVGINVLGALVMDFAFIAVALFAKHLPGGYWFVMIGPIVEGCVGGFGAAEAIVIAYLSDTTKNGERSRFFSLNLGMIFVGMAVGPTLGSVLRRATSNPLTVFYFSAACHALFSLVNWTIVPESLSPKRMARARRQQASALANVHGIRAISSRALGTLLNFARPLAVMLPIRNKGLRRGRKLGRFDWSLTLVGFSHMFSLMVMGADPYIFQYAQATYNWTSEELGYMLSTVGIARAIYLTMILPLLLRLFKPKEAAIQLPADPEAEEGSPPPSPESMTADLRLARLSLLAGFIAYPCMAIAPSGPAFTAAGAAGSLSSGVRPALQSVALAVYSSRGGKESGRLFGALSVLQALGVSVFGPALLGFVYLHTVGWLSEAFFWVAAAMTVTGFLLLQFVRLPEEIESLDEGEGAGDEENEVRASTPREETLIDSGSIDGGMQPGKKTVAVQE